MKGSFLIAPRNLAGHVLAAAFAALVFALPLHAQAGAAGGADDGSHAFDAESFFSAAAPEGAAGDDAGNAAESPSGALAFGQGGTEPGLFLSGSASADALYLIASPSDAKLRSGAYSGLTAFRLDAVGGDRHSAKVDASLVVRALYGAAADTARQQAAGALSLAGAEGAGALSAFILGAEGPVLQAELKKLYLSVYTPLADLSVGRMVLNYGRGTVFSPVDLFSSVDTADLALGRGGNDAARALVPFGNFSGLELASTIAGTPQAAIAGARLYGYAGGVDFGLMAFRDGRGEGYGGSEADGRPRLVLGGDLKADLGAGLSAEFAARLPIDGSTPSELALDGSEAVYSLMLGADYSLGGAWFFDLEYLWNLRTGDALPAGTFLRGHSLFCSLSWKPDELTALDARAMAAPADGLWQLSAGLSRSIADGASLMLYALYKNGDVQGLSLQPDLPAGTLAQLRTEGLSLGARLSVAF